MRGEHPPSLLACLWAASWQSRILPEPYSRPLAILTDKDHASGFESALDRRQHIFATGKLPCPEVRNRISMDPTVVTLSTHVSKRMAQPAINTYAAVALRHSFVATARNDFKDLREMK
jgi:hypothetical protein